MKPHTFILTREDIEKCQTPRGGYTPLTIRLLGTRDRWFNSSGQAMHGWKESLLGQSITAEAYFSAMAAADRHKPGQVARAARDATMEMQLDDERGFE